MKTKAAQGSLPMKSAAGVASGLTILFKKGITKMHHTERVIAGAFPSMVINCNSGELAQALEDHMTETHAHIMRLEKIMKFYDIENDEMVCETIEVLVSEGSESITSSEKGVMCDTAIIASAQRIEHFEIASYGNLRSLAEILGLREAAGMLDQILDEEKLADTKLTELSASILYRALNQSNSLKH